jgi:hydrogenase expression/formation protein HypC
MCLAIPGKIVSIKNQQAIVDFDGLKKEVNISLVDAIIGEFVLVHAGFAIEKFSKEEARKILEVHEK